MRVVSWCGGLGGALCLLALGFARGSSGLLVGWKLGSPCSPNPLQDPQVHPRLGVRRYNGSPRPAASAPSVARVMSMASRIPVGPLRLTDVPVPNWNVEGWRPESQASRPAHVKVSSVDRRALRDEGGARARIQSTGCQWLCAPHRWSPRRVRPGGHPVGSPIRVVVDLAAPVVRRLNGLR